MLLSYSTGAAHLLKHPKAATQEAMQIASLGTIPSPNWGLADSEKQEEHPGPDETDPCHPDLPCPQTQRETGC